MYILLNVCTATKQNIKILFKIIEMHILCKLFAKTFLKLALYISNMVICKSCWINVSRKCWSKNPYSDFVNQILLCSKSMFSKSTTYSMTNLIQEHMTRSKAARNQVFIF